MLTLWLLVCSTVFTMARGGTGDIPGNDPGQDIISSSTYTHVQGAYGAPTVAIRGAADGRLNEFGESIMYPILG